MKTMAACVHFCKRNESCKEGLNPLTPLYAHFICALSPQRCPVNIMRARTEGGAEGGL
jgi:hypothetical protein